MIEDSLPSRSIGGTTLAQSAIRLDPENPIGHTLTSKVHPSRSHPHPIAIIPSSAADSPCFSSFSLSCFPSSQYAHMGCRNKKDPRQNPRDLRHAHPRSTLERRAYQMPVVTAPRFILYIPFRPRPSRRAKILAWGSA